MIGNASAMNLYCPGCAPGDFAQPHICGLGTIAAPTFSFHLCPACGAPVINGGHACSVPSVAPILPRTSTTATIYTTPEPAKTCDHCYCLKQKGGWHDVPRPVPSWPGQSDRYHLKPHKMCCNCGNRRVKT